MQNLTKTGQWYWRDNEISLKSFQNLSRKEKEDYIKVLKELEPDARSTGDKIILNIYTNLKPENIKFISLD